LRYETVLRHACRRATSIVCVSEATLVGLRAAIGIDPRLCSVIGEGPQLFEEIETNDDAPDLDRPPFLLYVGSLDARKNVDTLVDAVLHADPPLPPLVIAGPASTNELAALKRRSAAFPGRVEHLGYVEASRLRALYAGCLGVVLPSLYEGFGLPVLEAFAADAPVVASDIPSVNEIARGAVLRVESPLDPRAWTEALRRLSAEPALRERLRDRGRVSAQRFTWPEVGAAFADLLVETAGNGPAGSRTASADELVRHRAAGR
jgi:glycosyltransferase involved in cell wall biosynthesis